MNDVRFLGGHGTPLPGGSRENPYNANHTGDPNPLRRWDSQYPSLWVKGGGTFLDIWTPSTFAQAGMRVSDTETEGRVYQLSSEHHVRNEIQLHNVTHWRFYALQTEEEYGESGHALPIDVSASRDILFANLHCYRVIGSVEPFPWSVNLTDSRDIRFRNMHCDSNSKVGFDATVFDEDHGVQLRAREFSWLDFTGRPPQKRRARVSPVVETGKPIRKLAGGFASISGSAAGPKGELYFVDVPLQKIYRWAGKLTCIDDAPVEPTNLIVDHGGNVIVVSRAGNGTVYALSSDHSMRVLEVQVLPGLAGKNFGLPISDWHVDREILAKPAGYFVSPDETVSLPVGADFLEGRARWHVKSSPQLRAFQLGRARPGTIFYLSDESELRTWAAEVGADGGLSEFRLFAEEGGEATAVDERGNVYIAAGEIFVYDRAGRLLDTIDVPERPTGLVFGGADGRTLFIPARTSLYALRMRYRGSDLTSP
jgi:sugar lactone lactonase YvrE